MNQDFLISGTAGMARRLVRLSRICTINLDPEIEVIAKTDLVAPSDFEGILNLSASEQQAVQSLIDFDFRAILPAAPGRGPHVALAAAKIAKAFPIVILYKGKARKTAWSIILKSFKFDPASVIFIDSIDADAIRDNRHGVLIIDEKIALGSLEAAMLSHDFQKTVLLCNRHHAADLTDAINILFPNSPNDILTNLNAYFKLGLEKKGFKTIRPEELAFLFNVVTDIIAFTKTAETQEDDHSDIDLELFAKLEHNVQLGHLRLS